MWEFDGCPGVLKTAEQDIDNTTVLGLSSLSFQCSLSRVQDVAWESGKTNHGFAAFGRCRSIYRHRKICPSVWIGMSYSWRGHIPPHLCILTAEEQLTAEINVIWGWNAIYSTSACQTIVFSRWQWNKRVSVRSLGNKEIFQGEYWFWENVKMSLNLIILMFSCFFPPFLRGTSTWSWRPQAGGHQGYLSMLEKMRCFGLVPK